MTWGPVKLQSAVSLQGGSNAGGLGGDLEAAFQASSQMLLMLLVCGPHFEKH